MRGARLVKAQGYTTLIGGIGVYDEKSIVDLPYRVHVNGNWSDVESTYDWCSGSGTQLDPFLVENIRINSSLQGTGFYIENSVDYFLIKNCIFDNSGRNDEHEAGVGMKNASNGRIVNCNFSFNLHGISVKESSYISIELSSILGSYIDILTGWGKIIFIDESHDIAVERIFSINHYDGICAFYSRNLDIRDNILVNEYHDFDTESAIYFFNTNYSSIVNNIIFGTSPTPIASSIRTAQDDILGITLLESFFNTVFGNRYFNINDFPEVNNELNIPGYNIFLFIVSISCIVLFLVRRKWRNNINI